jgi:hypothetical protein
MAGAAIIASLREGVGREIAAACLRMAGLSAAEVARAREAAEKLLAGPGSAAAARRGCPGCPADGPSLTGSEFSAAAPALPVNRRSVMPRLADRGDGADFRVRPTFFFGDHDDSQADLIQEEVEMLAMIPDASITADQLRPFLRLSPGGPAADHRLRDRCSPRRGPALCWPGRRRLTCDV